MEETEKSIYCIQKAGIYYGLTSLEIRIMSQLFGNPPVMNFKRTYLMVLALTLSYCGT